MTSNLPETLEQEDLATQLFNKTITPQPLPNQLFGTNVVITEEPKQERVMELTTEKLLEGKNEYYETAVKQAEENITNAQSVKDTEAFIMNQLKERDEIVSKEGIQINEDEHKYRKYITRLGELFIYKNYLPKSLRNMILDENKLAEDVQEAFSYESTKNLVKDKQVDTTKGTLNPYILTKQRIAELEEAIKIPIVKEQLLEQIAISRKRLQSTTSTGPKGITAEETAHYALFLLAAEKAINEEIVNNPDAVIIKTQSEQEATTLQQQTPKTGMEIKIDQAQRKTQVDEIDTSAFFTNLKERAAQLREKNKMEDDAKERKEPEPLSFEEKLKKMKAQKQQSETPIIPKEQATHVKNQTINEKREYITTI